MPHDLLRPTLIAGSLLSAGSALAAQVTELSPDKLAAFVAKNEVVVVQFTSPDPKCRYCIGADKSFDAAAAQAKNPALRFARVQWPVWHKIPGFEPLIRVGGIPNQVVFRKGKEMQSAGGRPESAKVLLDQIDAILLAPPAPGKDIAASYRAPAAPVNPVTAAPMSPEQQDVMRLMIRRDFFKVVTSACAKLFPSQAGQYSLAFDQWSATRKDTLNQAATVMLTHSSSETAAIFEAEKKTLQTWQVEKLGVPMDRDPKVKDCDKFAAGLDSAP